jgi:antitoxin ParD1/3/4
MHTGPDDKDALPDVLAVRNEATERWLRGEVVLTLEDARAHPERLLTADELRERLAHRIETLAGGRRRGTTNGSCNPG